VTLKWANGQTKSGHVKRIERSSDWYAENEWYTEASRLTVTMEASNGQESEPAWTDITSVTIRPGKTSDASCSYESDYTPWMYTCEVRNRSSAKLKAGGLLSVTSRHKWRLTFDDDSQVEFWLYKHAARMQDDGSSEMENPELYPELLKNLRGELAGLLTSITIR